MNCCALSPGCPASTGPAARAVARACPRCRGPIERGEARFLAGAVFHGGGIEREDFGVAAFFDALVETASGLFAQPAAAHHLLDQRGMRYTSRDSSSGAFS